MKDLLKEYFESKGSKSKTFVIIVVDVIYFIINAKITLWIANVISNAEAGNTEKMMMYLNLMIIGCIINTTIEYITTRLMRIVAYSVSKEANMKVAKKVLEADYDVFTKYSSGYITTIVGDSTSVYTSGKLLINLSKNLINFAVLIISICVIEWKLIIPIVVIYSIGALIIKKTWKIISEKDDRGHEWKAKRNDEIDKIIKGFSEVRSNCTEQYHFDKILQYNDEWNRELLSKSKVIAFNNVTFQVIDTIMTIVTILYVIIAVTTGAIQSSIGMSLVIYAWRLLDPLINMMALLDETSECKASFKRYKEFINIKSEIKDGNIELESFESSIKLKNVCFQYDKSGMILSNVNLTINKGEKIGICGHSGEGKSTLIKMIPRFYDVSDGELLIDGINIKNYKISSIREKIGIVHQSNYIFKGSIYDNIIYGIQRSVTESEVVEAAKQACIYDFIVSLPNGFKTDVGPNGLKLSGGQQQRISLARIFLKNPEIVILDEATSALDTESEAIIKDSMKLFKDKTVITIAHRLGTIKNCDRIVVINEHDISEEGTHEELIEKKGIYYSMYTA